MCVTLSLSHSITLLLPYSLTPVLPYSRTPVLCASLPLFLILDSVFLNVKFAHKWDTPATLGVEQDNMTVTSRGLLFQGTSLTQSKRFRLDLKFKKDILPDNSTWYAVCAMSYSSEMVDLFLF